MDLKFKLTPLLKQNLTGLPYEDVIRERQWITSNDILYLHKKYLKHIPLGDLLKGLEVHFPPKEIRPAYSAAFQRQLDQLKLKQQEAEYQSLISRVDLNQGGAVNGEDDFDLSPHEMAKQVKEQITTIFNIFISVASVVYAIWYWTANEQYFKLHTRVLLCLFSGILILVAEVVVYNSFLRKIDEAKTTERKKKEIKKVIDTVIIRG